ncbi:MAG: dynamin family protein [Lentisphaeria bacterium]|nr:dynamin family protein [Lentisphaeria bacterium]
MNKERLDRMLQIALEEKIPLREDTNTALQNMTSPHYVISLVGCFQVGKSTLLNRVLLGSETLLTEGKGLPTTAIPTKLVYGERKCLTVVHRKSDIPDQSFFDEEITDDLLRSLTTASTEAARLELANKIKYVQLAMPIDALQSYTFFDTPGIEDPNQDLIKRTTAEVLSESDLVVMVVGASRQLATAEISYLRSSIFNQGMSRAIVLASYNPKEEKPASERALIQNAIKAQLCQIGREYVPVHAYTYDPTVDGEILRGEQEIMSTLLAFLDENKAQSRIDKAAYALRGDFIAFMEKLNAQIEVNGKSKEALRELENKINDAAIELDSEYQKQYHYLSTELGRASSEELAALRSEFIDGDGSLVERFVALFQDCQDLASVKLRIGTAMEEITPDIEDRIAAVSERLNERFRLILTECSKKIEEAANRISISSNGYHSTVSAGWLGKVNPTLLKWLEIGAGFFFGNILWAIGLYFADKIPIIKNLLPHEFLRYVVLNTLKKSFIQSLEDCVSDLQHQSQDIRAKLLESLKEVFAEIYAERIAPYQEVMQDTQRQVLSEEQVAETVAKIKMLQNNMENFDI